MWMVNLNPSSSTFKILWVVYLEGHMTSDPEVHNSDTLEKQSVPRWRNREAPKAEVHPSCPMEAMCGIRLGDLKDKYSGRIGEREGLSL
jgi:hypothetical protein